MRAGHVDGGCGRWMRSDSGYRRQCTWTCRKYCGKCCDRDFRIKTARLCTYGISKSCWKTTNQLIQAWRCRNRYIVWRKNSFSTEFVRENVRLPKVLKWPSKISVVEVIFKIVSPPKEREYVADTLRYSNWPCISYPSAPTILRVRKYVSGLSTSKHSTYGDPFLQPKVYINHALDQCLAYV